MDSESRERLHDDAQQVEDMTPSASSLFAELEGQSLFGPAGISTFQNTGDVSLELTIDLDGVGPKSREAAIGDATLDELSNAAIMHSATTKGDNEHTGSLDETEHLHTTSGPNESMLQKASEEVQEYGQNLPSVETVPGTRLEHSAHPSFDVELNLGRDSNVETGGIRMEQKDFQIENNELLLEKGDVFPVRNPQLSENDSSRERDEPIEELQDPESGAQGIYRRNLFEEMSEGLEIEGSPFDTEPYGLDNRPGPLSQKYTLQHDDYDPEREKIGTDVQCAKNGDVKNTSDLFASPSGGQVTDKVVALSQAREPVSENIAALEFAAHLPTDLPNHAAQVMKPEGFNESSRESTDASANRWWESGGNDEEFNFGRHEDAKSFNDTLKQRNDASQDFPIQVEHSQEDPFSEILQANEQDLANPFALIDEPGPADFVGEKGFTEFFPMALQDTAPVHTHPDPTQPSTVASVSSLFGESLEPAKPFNGPDNPLILLPEDGIAEQGVQQNTRDILQASKSVVVPKNTPVANDELLGDLDFIDDSEFMAAFGTLNTATTAPPVPVQTRPSNEPDLTQQNRYLPQQPSAQPPHPQYPPQQSAQVDTSQQSAPSLNRYAPSTVPQPSSQTAPTMKSPQIPPRQPTWNQQQTPPRPPPTGQAPTKPSTSFVTAKGAYSSPYDLPAQIATKPKRHIPPVATYQQPPAADSHPPLSAPPSSRSTSSQPHFSPPPRFRSPGGQIQNQYMPPKITSPPILSTGIQGQNQYEAKRIVSPLSQPTVPTSQNIHAPRRAFSPPTQAPREGRSMSQSMYAPGSVSPPVHHQHIASHIYPPENVDLPQNQRSPGGTQFQSDMMSQSRPPTISSPPPAPPSNRYAPTQKLLPKRAVSAQQPQHPVQPTLHDRAPDVHMPHSDQQLRYDQQRISSPSYQHGHSNYHRNGPEPQIQAMDHARHPNQPLSLAQSNLGAPHSHYQVNQPPLQVPQDSFYLPPSNEALQVERDHHADLPPHFQMESGDYGQMYDPEGLSEPPLQVSDRNIMRTPEPIEPTQPDSTSDFSPPQPWERAASVQDQRIPPKQRPFSPSDPGELSQTSPPPLIPQSTTDRRRGSLSPQITRGFQPSPKRELSIDKSQSYPLRKPPAHLRAAMPSPAPRTLEEDFHARRGGYPVVNFGFGGQMITMIPRTPHRVNIRGPAPLSVPGMITFSNLRRVVAPPGLATSFPGPFYSANKPIKGKGKEIVKWLDDNHAFLDQLRDTSNLTENNIQRIEDRKILLKLLKLLIDNNGTLDGNAEVEKSVKEILMPQVANVASEGGGSFGVTASSLATSRAAQSLSADPNAVATYNLTSDFLRSMRGFLMQGDRKSAIQKAIDQKMWGHALLIASSVSPIVWCETVEQFIGYELREPRAKDFDSLRFLYGVLGGEGINAFNQLLPPINRMVSSVHSAAPSQIPQVGPWRESLGMVLLNHGSMDISSSITGLGVALVREGRVEAGHVCFLLAKFAANFSAADGPDTHYTLLGADGHGNESLVGLSQVLLSEVFEYSQSKFAPDGFLHLLPYKLWHAWALVDYGHFELAEKYCETVGAALQKEKKGSIFITPIMIGVLRELTERIAESSQDSFSEKSSWFGTKSARGDTFWKALETNLTKFVAGDETTEDAIVTEYDTKQVDIPDPRFGTITSETSLSRMASLPNLRAQATTPVYSGMLQDTFRAPETYSRYNVTTSESRYAPAARHDQGVPTTQERDQGKPGTRPNSRYGTPEPTNGGFSLYGPPAHNISQPPLPATLEVIEATPPEEPESSKVEEPIVDQEKETEESDKSTKETEKKASTEKANSGWFGSWFKRSSSEPTEGKPGKPIKAKLGEESSFVYDHDLKRWVNKKVGDTPAKAALPPPPPKRSVTKIPSTAPATAAPAAPTSATTTPTSAIPPSSTPTLPQTRLPPAPAPTGSAPLPTQERTLNGSSFAPPRPSTTVPPVPQKVDPLDALLSSRPTPTTRGPKKPTRSRYVDVMNKK